MRVRLRVVIAAIVIGLMVAAYIAVPMVRFKLAVDAYPDAEHLSARSARGLAEICAGCHGASGNSVNGGYATLAGQSESYLRQQLDAFATGRRASITMSPLAASLTEAQKNLLAQHFASNRWVRFDPPRQTESERAKARTLAAACEGCHGKSFEGSVAGERVAPRMAGQGRTYLELQMVALREGKRVATEAPAMRTLLQAMSPVEMRLVSAYLSEMH